ncbi:MAG: hypothetical protein QM770_02710 [Tepidisphaeraceae bacterium]
MKLKHMPRLSIGTASRADAKMATYDDLMSLADKRLYDVKQSRADQRVRRVA